MIGSDAASLFRQAELAFTTGKAAEARVLLRRIGPSAAGRVEVLHLTALVEKKLGDLPAAKAAFEAALGLAPNDAAINSNFGNLLEAMDDPAAALAHYDRALAADPGFINARFARSFVLGKVGRSDEALTELRQLAKEQPRDPRFPSALGNLLREAGDLQASAAAYDASLALDPTRTVALRGRARVALELGEAEAAERYRTAIARGVAGADVHLGYAQALEAGGRGGEAIAYLEQLTALQPTWIEGQATLANMRWEAGDSDGFTAGLEQLVAAVPSDAAAWRSLISSLSGADRHLAAAGAAEQALAATGDPQFALLAALYLSEAGQLAEADARFASLPPDFAGRDLHEASHHLRQKRIEQAGVALERARTRDPSSVAAWALTGVVWRLLTDERADWLSMQPGLVATSRLDLSTDEIASIASHLRRLHRTEAHPLGQSLRGGTQTRGRLLQRIEPEIGKLRAAIEAQVEAYWRALPAQDPAHPLLRHREGRPVIQGSWSVRLTAGGFHVAHFHTRGIVSSACYFVLPEATKDTEGWLEIGGAPANLALDLEPLHRVEPKPGRMALFPSYLFHGTRPFAAGERLTAAFDVVAK